MAKITVQNITKIFGSHVPQALRLYRQGISRESLRQKTRCTVALEDVSFEIHENEIVVIMGLSGSGKSTLLRCINGLVTPTAGSVMVDGVDVASLKGASLRHLRQKNFGMVFQNFALFPHRTVLQNVGFGLEIMGVQEQARVQKSKDALEKVGLSQWLHAYPHQLSGGMKQRVGLARALVMEPKVLLMDEAFSALDPLIRQEMQDELLLLQEQIKKTIVFITHDLNEAFKLGSRVILLQDGKVVQIGSPEEILMAPANEYVARFVASANFTQVLTAASVMKRSEAAAVLGLDGPRAVLHKMRLHSIASLFVVDSHRHFVGILHAIDAERMVTEGQRNLELITQKDIVTVEPEVPIAQVMALMADLAYPLAVVDSEQHLKGVIVRGLVLGALVERGGCEHAA